MKVGREPRSKAWKTGNPYLASILPDGPLMTLERDPNVPFISESTESTPLDFKRPTRPSPRELIQGTDWERDFHNPLPLHPFQIK